MSAALSLDEITERLRRLGCSDHGCVVSKPKGMGTNGGCKCLPWESSPDGRGRIREALVLLQQQAEALRGLAESIRRDRDILAEQVERAAAVTRERERIATETATNRTRREERIRAAEICQWLANTWDRDPKLTRLRREERGEAAGEIMREIHRESANEGGAA